MNIQSQAVSDALALFPVYPPQIAPVQPSTIAHGGVSQAAFTPDGLEVIIEPITGLQNWVVAAFDVMTLFVNNVRTNVSKTIRPGEEGKRLLLLLPEFWFTNGVNDVRYQVTRVSGNKDDSPTLQLLYHNPAPTITISHPPSIVPGKTAVIIITVGYARAYDKVTLIIGTWRLTFTNPDPTKPITYTLTAADLQSIGDGTHPVSGNVVDQLTNSGVSATTSITISANQRVLNPPIIVEAETNNRVLDVNDLKGKNATIHALTWTGMADKQACWMRVESFKANGTAHDLQLWNGLPAQTNPTWISQGQYVQTLLNNYVSALGDGKSLTLKFWVSLDGTNSFATATPFPDQIYTVEALVAPTITNVNENTTTGTPVANGGFTTATTLAFTGNASADQQIQLLDKGVVQDTILVPISGQWTYTLTSQTQDIHKYAVKALYADGQTSEQWITTIVKPLSINTSQMNLNGVKLLAPFPTTTKEVPGNTMVREAMGGIPGIEYASLNPTIASVTRAGKVTGLRNGFFTIIAIDGGRSQVSYHGVVTNVFTLLLTPITERLDFDGLDRWASSMGGIQLPGANDAGPVLNAFITNFSNLGDFFRQMLPNNDPRNWVTWQAPTRDGLVAGFVRLPDGNLTAIAYDRSGHSQFPGPAFAFRST